MFPTYFSYTGVTIPNYWSNLSIEFDNLDGFSAIKKIIDATWWVMRFSADWVVYFNARSTITSDHTIVFGKHITEIEQREESSQIANKVKVKWSWGITWWTSDTGSQTAYGIREKFISDTSLKDVTTWSAYATAYVAKNKDPKLNSRLAINDSYAIGTILAGHVLKIVGDPVWIGNKYVEKLDYSPDKIIVHLDSYISTEKALSNL